MSEREPSIQVARFIERLRGLSTGERARLKRNASRPLAEATDVLGLFYRLLLAGVPTNQEETYFLVATLYPLAEDGGSGDFGAALARARTKDNRKGLERRVEILLDADEAQLAFRLRQAVRFLSSQRVSINYGRLLEDLLYWGVSGRLVQQRWARSFFAG